MVYHVSDILRDFLGYKIHKPKKLLLKNLGFFQP